MKTKMLHLVAGFLIASTRVALSADALDEALQKGLLEEEANHNLDAAIQAYQSVASQYDDQRKIAATAVFRLGECYRKQGKTNEAVAAYQRVVQDFADQNSLVGPSEKNLAALGRGSSGEAGGHIIVTAPTVSDPDQLKLLLEEIKLVEADIASVEARLKNGKAGFADLVKPKKDLLSLQRQLPRNAGLAAQKNLVEQQIQLVEQLLAEMNKRVEVGAVAPLDTVPLQRELIGLKRELISISKGPATARAAADDGVTDVTDEETKEIQRLKEFIKNSPDLINAKGQGDYRPLHSAVLKGQRAVVEFLLRNGAAVDAMTHDGNTPLHFAALAGHRAIAELLLENGCDVNCRNGIQATPLHIAASRGYKAIAELLLAKGADINLTASSGAVAADVGTDPPRSIRTQVTEGVPLCTAILSSSSSVVDLLIAAKPDVNRGDGQCMTPLHAAVIRGSVPLGERLLAMGANVEAKAGPSGRTPLHIACLYGNVEMVRWLIGHKAKINAPDKDGATPLHLGIAEATGQPVNLLLEKGADVNAKNNEGATPLHLAVASNQKKVVELLLDKGADVGAKDVDGRTPLSWATEGVKHGRGGFGYVRIAGAEVIAMVLREHGAKE